MLAHPPCLAVLRSGAGELLRGPQSHTSHSGPLQGPEFLAGKRWRNCAPPWHLAQPPVCAGQLRLGVQAQLVDAKATTFTTLLLKVAVRLAASVSGPSSPAEASKPGAGAQSGGKALPGAGDPRQAPRTD